MNIDVKNLLWLLHYLVPAIYLVAFLLYGGVFFREHPQAKRAARPVLIAAVLCNLVYLVVFTAHFAHIPAVSVHQVLAGIGFAVAATYLVVEGRTGTLFTGPFVLCLVLICQIDGLVHPRLDHHVPEVLQSAIFSVHVTTAVLGYSAFALAAIYGLIYLLLYNEMRLKRFGLIFRRLPPLATLDKMNFYSAVVGFIFLTLAVGTGFSWAMHEFRDKIIDPKLVIGVLTWLLYGAAILGRQYKSWRGPRLAYSSLIGFVVILVSMYSINFFFSKFHVFA